MDRRTFIKITGLGSVAFAAGCTSDPENKLYSLVKAPEDMVTGRAALYASTCRECPAGCGVLANNREGRVTKLEGNPLHPVNRGRLCMRGQAALQALYNPDRLKTPLVKKEDGWHPISTAQAQALLQERMAQAATRGSEGIGMLSEVIGETLLDHVSTVLSHYRSRPPLVFEPLAFESLKFAHQQVFGRPILPSLRMEQADVLVSLGADFLETWLSPVEYARKFKAMHAVEKGRKGLFVQISPYQSLTAANADRWLACRPDTETAVALMMIRRALESGRGGQFSDSFRSALDGLSQQYSLEKTAQLTGLAEADLEKLTTRLLKARKPLVLGSATACHGPSAVALDLATTILNVILDPELSLYDFDQRHRVEIAKSRAAIEDFWGRAAQTPPDVLLLNNVNPLYSLSPRSKAAGVLTSEKTFVVAFTNFMDETADAADLIFPTQLALETWDIYESKQAMSSMLQPTLGRINDFPGLGDVFMRLLPKKRREANDYRQFAVRRFSRFIGLKSEQQWVEILQSGGQFVAGQPTSRRKLWMTGALVAELNELVNAIPQDSTDQPTLYLKPSLRHLDGRGANRPWLSEIPDPVSQVAWQTLIWVHPNTMHDQGWDNGQTVRLTTPEGQIDALAYPHGGLHPSVMVIPMGQGHADYGRYARSQGANPVKLMAPESLAKSGAPIYAVRPDGISGSGKIVALAAVSGSRVQHDRKIALSVDLAKSTQADETGYGLTMNDFPFTLPLPEGYDAHRDIYKPHQHDTYRWGMVVDLDRCIGCSACVAGCYAENNIGMVGERQVVNGREMAWLRIERYEDPDDPTRLIFLPVMCQHCDNAPCEAVCPVYAPHHSKEGLNNQIYNRCIGTRFCAQNCPYKIRRFNWFEWKWPEPLNMQLNPNVTVRTKGIMEKCSFCIQRIKVAHGHAKDEERNIKDGEVVPACVQTCPTNALFFGNLMDTESTVRKLIEDPRGYQIMGYLNIKPAVIYLKKVTQTI